MLLTTNMIDVFSSLAKSFFDPNLCNGGYVAGSSCVCVLYYSSCRVWLCKLTARERVLVYHWIQSSQIDCFIINKRVTGTYTLKQKLSPGLSFFFYK